MLISARNLPAETLCMSWISLADGIGVQVGVSVLTAWIALSLVRSIQMHGDWIELIGIALGVVWSLQVFTPAIDAILSCLCAWL